MDKHRYYRDCDEDIWIWNEDFTLCKVWVKDEKRFEFDDPQPDNDIEYCERHWGLVEITKKEAFMEML